MQKKLLLLLMVLLAAALPGMAQEYALTSIMVGEMTVNAQTAEYNEDYLLFPTEGWGSKGKPLQLTVGEEYTVLFSIKDGDNILPSSAPVYFYGKDENGVMSDDGIHGPVLGDDGFGHIPGWSFTKAYETDWDEWHLIISEATSSTMIVATNPCCNAPYVDTSIFLYVEVAEAGAVKENVYAPTLAITTDLTELYNEEHVMLNTASVTVTPDKGNSEGVATYYFYGNGSIMAQTDDDSAAYSKTVTDEPKLDENGQQYREWTIQDEAGNTLRTVESVEQPSLENGLLNEGEKVYWISTPVTVSGTVYYNMNEGVVALEGTDPVEITAADLAEGEHSFMFQAVSAKAPNFAAVEAGPVHQLAVTGFFVKGENGNENIETTEAAPYVFADYKNAELYVANTITGNNALSYAGADLYYTINDSEPAVLEGNKVPLTNVGESTVKTWFQAKDNVELKSAEQTAYVKVEVLESDIPATPTAKFGSRSMADGSSASATYDEVVSEDPKHLTFSTETNDAEIYYTINDGKEELYAAPGITFSDFGTFVVTAKAAIKGLEPKVYSDPITVTITVTGATAPSLYLNAVASENAIAGKTIDAQVDDKLIFRLYDTSNLVYTITPYNGEVAGEPKEVTVDADEIENHTVTIELEEAGTFHVEAYTLFGDDEDSKSEDVSAIIVVAENPVPSVPTIVAGENNTFTIVPGKRTTKVYWSILPYNDSADDVENLTFTEVEVPVTEAPEVTEPTEDTEEEPTEPAEDPFVVKSDVAGYVIAYATNDSEEKSEYAGLDLAYKHIGTLGKVELRINGKLEAGQQVKEVYLYPVGAAEDAEPIVADLNGLTLNYSGVSQQGTEYYYNKHVVGDNAVTQVIVEEALGCFKNLSFTDSNIYTLTATWNAPEGEKGWYFAGSSEPVDVEVYATVKEATTATGTDKEGHDYSVPFIQINEGATEISFDVPEGVQVWYAMMNDAATANSIIRRVEEAAAFDPAASGFTLAADNKMPIENEAGSFLAVTATTTPVLNDDVTVTEGLPITSAMVHNETIYSPAQQYYYGTNAAVLDDITTGIYGVGVDAEGVEYYDLNGLRVNGNELKAGIYVRVANGKATKVVVK